MTHISAATPDTDTNALSPEPFGQRMAAAMARHGPLCLGLDPYIDRIPHIFSGCLADRLHHFGRAVIEAAAGKVAALKPQIALFERHGPPALNVLADLTRLAQAAGLLVLLDAKRGDIGSTADGYAQAYLGPDAWLHADAVTVNPLMGADTLAPFCRMATQYNKGVIALLRTSNPGASDIQDIDAGGQPVWQRIGHMLGPIAADLTPAGAAWSSLMAVVGATNPDQARQARGLLPNTLFLAPGYGAQGASAADALAGCIPAGSPTPPSACEGVANGGTGVLVTASRSVLYGDNPPADLAEWRAGFDARLAAFATDIKQAQADMTPTVS